MEAATVALDTLHPNPWNPNRMDERQYAAELESIQTYGFIDPVTVRPHPEHPGEYQIIDGEHRQRAATELGLLEVPATILHGLTDADAKKLTIVMNETRGKAGTPELATLLAELHDSIGDALQNALPYTPTELSELVEIGSFDFSAFDEPAAEPTDADRQALADSNFTTFELPVPAEAVPVIEEALAAFAEAHGITHDKPRVLLGLALELLAAETLATHA